MNIFDRFTMLKPYFAGAVLGAVAISIVGFSANWVVATGTMESRIEQSRVAALTEICTVNAKQFWAEAGNQPAALKGWTNEQRKLLAEQFTPRTAGDSGIKRQVIRDCDNALRPA